MPFLPASTPVQIPETQSDSTSAWDALSSTQQVQSYVNAGYTITQDGMSGTQLLSPRKMKGLDKAVLIIGGFLLFVPYMAPLGLFFAAIAGFDYFVLTKRHSVFVPRR